MKKKSNHTGKSALRRSGRSPAKKGPVQEARERPDNDAAARNLIACTLALSSTVFLAGAALYGWSVGDFSALTESWHALAPILAMMLAYYFSRRDADP